MIVVGLDGEGRARGRATQGDARGVGAEVGVPGVGDLGKRGHPVERVPVGINVERRHHGGAVVDLVLGYYLDRLRDEAAFCFRAEGGEDVALRLEGERVIVVGLDGEGRARGRATQGDARGVGAEVGVPGVDDLGDIKSVFFRPVIAIGQGGDDFCAVIDFVVCGNRHGQIAQRTTLRFASSGDDVAFRRISPRMSMERLGYGRFAVFRNHIITRVA